MEDKGITEEKTNNIPPEEIFQIFDKVFKKVITLSTRAVINLINGLFDTDYPLDTLNLTDEQKANVKYDPSDILVPRVDDRSRVYKGGSWNDRIYWLNPTARRYMQQDQSSSTVGFRCAMSILGKD